MTGTFFFTKLKMSLVMMGPICELVELRRATRQNIGHDNEEKLANFSLEEMVW